MKNIMTLNRDKVSWKLRLPASHPEVKTLKSFNVALVLLLAGYLSPHAISAAQPAEDTPVAQKKETVLDNQAPERVDFSYAFATPHRLTVALPDSSDKTLLDLQPGSLRIAWTYDDLLRFPLAAFMTPQTSWEVKVEPQLDGHAFPRSTWRRLDAFLPALENEYSDAGGGVTLKLQVVGGASAALIRVDLASTSGAEHRVTLK